MWDALAAGVWYAVTANVIYVAWLVSRHAFRTDTAVQRMMHSVVLVWVWIAIVSFALGLFGLLNAVSLAAGVIAAAAVTWWCARRWKAQTPSLHTNTLDKDAPDQDQTASLLAVGTRLGNAWHVFWIGAAALAAGLVIFGGLLQFPSNWDTLMYHRPMINLWLQTGSLYVPECAVWYNPSSNELIGLWWAVAFSGDFWVGLVNVPATLLLGLGAYELGRRLGLTPMLRHATVIAIFGSSIVFGQISNAKNDVAACSLFLAGVAYGIRYVQGRNRWDLVLGAVAFGLVAGVKYYALGYAAVGWLGLAAMAWVRHGHRAALAAALAVAGIMSLTGGYWYGRNLAMTGTPFFPVGYVTSSTEPQMSRSAWQSSLVGNGRVDVWPQYVDAVRMQGDNCHVLAVLALPLSLSWLLGTSFVFWIRRGRSGPSAERCASSVMLVGAWLVFGVTPFTVNPDSEQLLVIPWHLVRFSQVPLALSVIAFSLVILDVAQWMSRSGNTAPIRLLGGALLPGAFAAMALVTFFANAITAMEDNGLLILLLATNAALLFVLVREVAHVSSLSRGTRPSVGACGSRGDRPQPTGPVRDGTQPNSRDRSQRNSDRTSKPTACHMGRVRPILFSTILIGGGMTVFVFSTMVLSAWWHGNFAAHYDQFFRTEVFSQLEGWDGPAPAVVALQFRYYPFFGSRRQIRAARPRHVPSEEYLLGYLAWHRADAVAAISAGQSTFVNYGGGRAWLQQHPDVFHTMDSGGSFTLYSIEQPKFRELLDVREVDGASRSW